MKPVLIFLFLVGIAGAALAEIPEAARSANVIFLGEVHDNPTHHATQAAWVAALKPQALVFEMIPAEVADAIETPDGRTADELEAALDWAKSGWPEFALYYPIFAAAPTARLYGAAVPRAEAHTAMRDGIAALWSPADMARFGLDRPLAAAEQTAREADQMHAHCDALPETMLQGMVTIQRLRDAALARAALSALRRTEGPVIVITGNGHARPDRGAPAVLHLAAPEVSVFTLGQTEDGRTPEAAFDAVADAPSPEREDPCAAFR